MKADFHNVSGLVGVCRSAQAAEKVYFGLHSILHRGSDAVGIAASNGEQIKTIKGLGLLSEIITEKALSELEGNQAIGHIRMSVGRKAIVANNQPVMVSAIAGQFCVVASSSLTNAASIRESLKDEGLIFQGTSDAELIAHLIQRACGSMAEKIQACCEQITGPYTFLCMTKNTLYATRSADGIRPLFLAVLKEGYALASETAAFNLMEVEEMGEVAPGSLFCCKKEGLELISMKEPQGNLCAMEYVYYSRPDSIVKDASIHTYRKKAGELLAKGESIEADFVIGVPDTALSAAAAFAQALHKPYETGLIKNRYIGSTFVQPLKAQRASGMRVRLNAISSMVKDKKIYVVDDSIKKGETARRVCQLLKEAGAREVHLRIAAPKISHPCFYGYEYIPKEQLLVNNYSEKEMCELFGIDSLRFLSLEDFLSILPEHTCMACMSGAYPLDLGDFYEAI